jgi:methylaspartate ammonia-lyase
VKTIDKLELVKYPDVDKIKEIFDGYNYCESDSDCGYVVQSCSTYLISTFIPLNIKYVSIADLIVSSYKER